MKVVERYVDKAGEHRWRMRDLDMRVRDPEGEIIASGEGYTNEGDRDALSQQFADAFGVEVRYVDQ